MKLKTKALETEIARRALTYKQTASDAGISEKTLQAARRGKEIRTATAGKIAQALGVEPEAIIKGRTTK